MKNLPLWAIIGSAMVVVSFIIGWLRNKRNYCRVTKDRYGADQGNVFNIAGAVVFALWALLESGSKLDELLIAISSFRYLVITFITLLIGYLALKILQLSHIAGKKLGAKYTARAAKRHSSKCRDCFDKVMNCPRAGRNCPLKGSALDFNEIVINDRAARALIVSADPDETAQIHAFFKVKNLKTGEYGFAIEKFPKKGLSFFIPIQTYKKTARELREKSYRPFKFPDLEPVEEESPSVSDILKEVSTFSEGTETAEKKPSPRATVAIGTVGEGGKITHLVGCSAPEGSESLARARAKAADIPASASAVVFEQHG